MEGIQINQNSLVTIEFCNVLWYWRGPAPFYFLTVPVTHTPQIKEMERLVTYGWGMIPATVRIGNTEWTTALFPKDGAYIVPIKTKVRKAEGLEEGDSVSAVIEIGG